MSKRRKILFLSLMIVIILAVILLFYFIVAKPNGNDLSGIQLPSTPAADPIENVNSSIIYKEKEWTTNFTHDPAITKVDDWYYVFSTDYMVGAAPKPGIQIRKSKDLIHWEFVGRVFDQVSTEAWEWTKGTTFWAPDIVEMNNRYFLYYSVSEVGKRNSYIGLATSDSIEGPWKDEGAVFKSKEGDEYTVNAIDPNIILDKEGNAWMVYGSYFGGIFITEIDKNTGKLKSEGEEGTLIAQRKNMNFGIEGPEIMYNPDTDYYYLTISYEWLEDTYNVRTARSRSITGPYVDYNDKDMIDTTDESFNTGNKIVGSYSFGTDEGWQGTGHNGLFEENGEYFLLHNARAVEDIYWSHLHVRKILWTEDGWPVVSPERYAGEKEQVIKEKHIIGDWEKILLVRYDDNLQSAQPIKLLANGKIEEKSGKSNWELTGENTLKLSIYEPGIAPDDYWRYTLKVIPGWDWENWNGTLVFTGMDQEGTVLWGKKIIENNK
jgi:arabinan endo-1,5-alpha-L-arabinosidase